MMKSIQYKGVRERAIAMHCDETNLLLTVRIMRDGEIIFEGEKRCDELLKDKIFSGIIVNEKKSTDMTISVVNHLMVGIIKNRHQRYRYLLN